MYMPVLFFVIFVTVQAAMLSSLPKPESTIAQPSPSASR